MRRRKQRVGIKRLYQSIQTRLWIQNPSQRLLCGLELTILEERKGFCLVFSGRLRDRGVGRGAKLSANEGQERAREEKMSMVFTSYHRLPLELKIQLSSSRIFDI